MLYFSLTYHVTYLMKVTGTQCSPMYPTWISCGLPGKWGSLRLWKFVSPKYDFPEKSISLPSLLSTMKKEKLSSKITGSVNTWISRTQETKKPWHNSHSPYQNIMLKPTPSCRPYKAFWMIIKSLSKQSSTIPTLSCDDSLATSDYNKANCQNVSLVWLGGNHWC